VADILDLILFPKQLEQAHHLGFCCLLFVHHQHHLSSATGSHEHLLSGNQSPVRHTLHREKKVSSLAHTYEGKAHVSLVLGLWYYSCFMSLIIAACTLLFN
jgi:hypothetical protein